MPFAAIGATLAGTATSAQIATTALTLGGAGLGLGIAGTVQAGREAKAFGESQAALLERNAQLAEREAIEAREAAAFEERKFRKGAERLKARQRIGFAKAGVTFEGSPLEVMEQTAIELETDALMIRRGGQLGARRLTAEAQLQRFAGRSALLKGRAARRASVISALSTGLIGGAQLGYMGSQLGGKVGGRGGGLLPREKVAFRSGGLLSLPR